MRSSIDIKKILGIPESSIREVPLYTYSCWALITLIAIVLAVGFEEYLLLGIPFGLLLVYQTVLDFKKVFYALLFTIPLSIEFFFPNGLATDLPTEPLVVGLMIAFGLNILTNSRAINWKFYTHPISIVLGIHLLWTLFTVCTAQNIIVSIKFMLAKTWYIVGYYCLAGHILCNEKEIKKFFWLIFIPFILAVAVTFVRHAMIDFSFFEVHSVMKPCFRNHVLYAAILAIFLPFIVLASTWYSRRSILKWGLLSATLFIVIAIYYSYTRTAYIAVMIAIGSYFLIRLRLMKIAVLGAVIALLIGGFYVTNDNKYLDFAPDFEKTITHREFEDLVSATAKGQDVSTMERVYRWVAALQMSKEQPLVGYGPGNFYNFYKPYAVNNFETYVSDNPEKSGIHCYYLMILTEQGIPGALIFLGFTFFVLIYGEQIYTQTKHAGHRNIVMTLLLSIIIIDAFLIINDMVETDKVGSFYFMNIAMLVNMDLLVKKSNKKSLVSN